jgi:hypothetical protein
MIGGRASLEVAQHVVKLVITVLYQNLVKLGFRVQPRHDVVRNVGQ